MIRRFWLKLTRRRRMRQDLETELAFHREMAEAAGNPIPFGNTSSIREQAFDLWRFNGIENLWRDITYAVRSLGRSPGFVLAALFSLALGIGVNTAIFSIAVEFLLSDPSVRDPQTIAAVRQGGNSHVTAAYFDALARSPLFEAVAGEHAESYVNFDNGSDTRRVFAVQATRNYFTALGVPVALGRGWSESDSDQVVVLHPRFWRARLGGDPSIIGKSIRLDGRLYTVLGILRDDHRTMIGYGFAPDVWVPRFDPAVILQVYARVKPGMTIDQLNAAMPALSRQMDALFPWKDGKPPELRATPVVGFARLQKDGGALSVALFFALLLVVVGLVLLIACVNVAGLLLARAAARRPEIAIRLSLGASRGRLLQQLLAESLLLSVAGAGLGFLMAEVIARAAGSFPLPAPVPLRLYVQPDWRVAAYAAALAIFSALASGLAPAWQAVRESIATGVRRERRLGSRRALVVAQIAVSFVVLMAAALFLRNLVLADGAGPGFDTRNTIRAEVHLPRATYRDARSAQLYVDRTLDQLRSIPGVESAAAARIVPFTDATTFGIDLRFTEGGTGRHAAFNWNAVSPDYFRAMGVPIRAGRAFNATDTGESRVAIVNQVFVDRYLAGRRPVGTIFYWGDRGSPYEIVGVVAGTKNITLGEDPRAQLFEPLTQSTAEDRRLRVQFVVRSATPPIGQLAAVNRVLRSAEPGSGLEVETMFSAIGFAYLPSRVGAILVGSMGAVGLLLAVIGLYGVLSYAVVSRTGEIGIRMAVGATGREVSRMVLVDSARLVLTGIAIGLPLALFVTRPLTMFLIPGLRTSDPVSFGGVIAVLVVTGVLAALDPVRRAVRVDPLRCLRYE